MSFKFAIVSVGCFTDGVSSGPGEWFDNCSWVDAVSWGCNGSLNATQPRNATATDVTSLVLMAVTSVVLALIILATIVGESQLLTSPKQKFPTKYYKWIYAFWSVASYLHYAKYRTAPHLLEE